MGNMLTITITVSVDMPDGVTPHIDVRTSPYVTDTEPGPPPTTVPDPEEAEALRTAVKALAPVSKEFARIVAERALRGEAVVVDMDIVRRLGFEDGRFVGGAIGAAATKLHKAVGTKRDPLHRVSENPPTWEMTREDALIVLEALGQAEKVEP